MKKVLTLMLLALISCTRQDVKLNSSVNNSTTARPQGNIACVCVDTAKRTYHIWVQTSSIDTATDVIKLKLVDDTVVSVIYLKVKNGDQFTKIKYQICGVGILKLNVVRNDTINYNCGTWTDLACNHYCNSSGGSDCPQNQ